MLEFILNLFYCAAFFVAPILLFTAIGSPRSRPFPWMRVIGSLAMLAACGYVYTTYPAAETAGCCGLAVLVLTSVFLAITLSGAPSKN